MPTLIELPEIDDCAGLCRELGLQFIELNMNLPQYQVNTNDLAKLKEIAENNGFPNLSYFNRQFKLQYTIPPGVYRRHNSWSAGEKEKLP